MPLFTGMQRLTQLYIDIHVLRPRTVGAYAFAFAFAFLCAAVATVLGVAINPHIVGVPFVTFIPAVIITTLIGGFGAGLFCTVVSTALASFFVLPPSWSFNVEDVMEISVFSVEALFYVIIIAGMRFTIERYRELNQKLEQQGVALGDSEQRVRLALNAAQLGSWQYDPLHRVISGDTRFKEIFDVADHETAIDEIVKRVHPGDMGRIRAAFDAALDPADPKPLAIVYRAQRKDGAIRWMEIHGLAYFDGAGRERRAAHVVGTVADITERKENAEKAHLLTREINHRAKNMLSVVDAISHQIAAGHPDDFAQRFSERIQALSTNQDLLIRNEWKGVEIEDLVRAQLAHFVDLIGSRITAQGPKLLLRGAAAQAIGLALHELATNAGKYGALSTDIGRVDIYWGSDGDTLTMSWTERDGPPVSAPERRGFGTIVMKAMAERSLDGQVQLNYARSGLIWRLACPAANALSRDEDCDQIS
jgi:PAS domain S-box-containing protein